MVRTPGNGLSLGRLLLLLVSFFVVFLSACATNPATGKSQLSLMSMSTEEEVSLGREMFPRILQKMGGAYPDKDLQLYLQGLGDTLKNASYRKGLTYTFKVVNNSTPNAFAMPGGYIAITRGLMVQLENDAQLAAVIGHEIGHVDARHAVQGLQRSNLLGLGLAVLSGVTGGSQYGGLIRSSGEVAATLVDRSYSRGQEEESDRLGIDYMVKSGYNPNGAIELQQIFYEKIDQKKDPEWVEGLFRTHPFSLKRLEENRDYINLNYSHYRPIRRPAGKAFLQATQKLRLVQPGYMLYDRARLAEKEGKPDEAIALYLQAAAEAPDEALILTGLGMAYLRQEDIVTAKRYLSRAVRFDGNYYYSRLGLGYIFLEQKNYQKASSHLERSVGLLPTLQGGYFLAQSYEGTGRKNDALELYRAVAESDNGKLGSLARDRLKVLEGK